MGGLELDTLTTNEIVVDTATFRKDQQDEINRVIIDAKSWVDRFSDGGKLAEADLIPLLVFVMQTSQKVVKKRRHGKYKKQLVITVIRQVMNSAKVFSNMSPAQREMIITTMVSPTIDTMINIARNNIDLGKIKNKIEKLCGC
jgi:hypothetical protein